MRLRHLPAICTMGVLLLAAATASAQQQMPVGPMGSNITAAVFHGVFSPTVGSGSVYEFDNEGKKNQVEIGVVGKEDVAGKPGSWVELGMDNPQGSGKVYVKMLMVVDGDNATISRMIMQPPGMGPMEMPMRNMPGMQQSSAADVRSSAEKVGSESVTTPAGTFNCDHYRAKDGSWDAWISTQVVPWGVVKSTSKDMNMTLTQLITNATDHITGTPQSMDQMMRGMGMGRGR
jgi:hypothetical protein